MGEPGLGGWIIWVDRNSNGLKDPGEETVTNPDGSLYFAGLADSIYTLHEEMQTGWTQTHPGAGGAYTVTVQSGQPIPSILFGNQAEGEEFLDFGDAPDSYGTLRASGGAYHSLSALSLGKIYVDAWIDLDVDGTWQQATDQILKTGPVAAGLLFDLGLE